MAIRRGRTGNVDPGRPSPILFLHGCCRWRLYVLAAATELTQVARRGGPDRHARRWRGSGRSATAAGNGGSQRKRPHAGLPYGFAATYSLPPEGFVSLVVPGFFGDFAHVSYWGRWNMWESSLFIGAIGLVLAVYGAIYGARRSDASA